MELAKKVRVMGRGALFGLFSEFRLNVIELYRGISIISIFYIASCFFL